MPQRRFSSQSFGPINKTGEVPPTLSPTDERALIRIGYDRGPAEELGWFIRLASTDWDRASEGDLLNLREEFLALQKVRLRVVTELPGMDVIQAVQPLVRRHLTDLADKGATALPQIPVTQFIEYPRVAHKLWAGETHASSAPLPKNIPDCISLYHAPQGIGLIVVMGHLLATVRHLITRCPHCTKIFLQSRRNQEYCSRSCQNIAVVRRHRAAEKEAKSRGIRAKKQRGGQHGKKRR